MGIISCYDGNGNPLDKGTLVHGNGTVNYYDEKGTLTETKTFVDGLEQK